MLRWTRWEGDGVKKDMKVCGSCDGSGIAYTMEDEESIGQPYGSSGIPCPDCNQTPKRVADKKARVTE